MKLDRLTRIVVALLILLVFIVAIGAMLFLTESALNVWDRLLQGPKALRYGYLAVMAALVVTAVWLVWRLVVRRKIRPAHRQATAGKLTREEIRQRI